jgi:hypothetical protein
MTDLAPPPHAHVVQPVTKPPLYWRLLRLRQIHPNGWQRASLVEGVIAISVILVLADVASAWTLLVLPVTTAVVVKAHDVLVGMLAPGPAEPSRETQNRG